MLGNVNDRGGEAAPYRAAGTEDYRERRCGRGRHVEIVAVVGFGAGCRLPRLQRLSRTLLRD
jgi:hypothetical protein